MIGPYKYAIAGIALVAAGAGVLWYGASRYDTGYDAAVTEMAELTRQEEIRLREARDAAELKWREAELARAANEKLIDDQRSRIDRLLSDLAHQARNPKPASSTDGVRATGVDVLTACVREYDSMGRDAARLADKVNGLQEYVRAITTKSK